MVDGYRADEKPWYCVPEPITTEQVVIIGGGVAGATVAYALAKRGMDVLLLDKANHIAAGASGNPAAAIMPILGQSHDPVPQFSVLAYQWLIKHLAALSTEVSDFHWQPTGVLALHMEQKLRGRVNQLRAHSMQVADEIACLVSAEQATELSLIHI